MIVSGQTLRRVKPVSPFCERTRYNGVTYGVGPAGYDVRIDQTVRIPPGGFTLASTLEEFGDARKVSPTACRWQQEE